MNATVVPCFLNSASRRRSFFPALISLWCCGLSAQAVDLPLLWRWSNPVPHGANIVDQAANPGLTVQVGERGQVFLSDDWELWVPRDSYTTAALRGVTWFGGRLVITGEAGTVLYADDPWNFRGLTLGTTDWLESVAASAGLVVAVGDHAAIYTSTNGVDWKRVTPAFNNWLRSVASNGEGFVTVGEGGLIASSPDGNSWQVRSSGTTLNLNRVAWMGDHYLVVGDNGKAMSSADGSQWSPVAAGATNHLYALAGVPQTHLAAGKLEARLSENNGAWSDLFGGPDSPVPPWTYYSALWNSGYYLLSGHAGMAVEGIKTNSVEPAKWHSLSDSVRTWLWSVTRTTTHYLAVGDYGTILSSPNGIDWDLELVSAGATNSVLLGIGGATNLVLAVGSRGTVLWATNAFLWHTLAVPPTQNDLQGVCYHDGQFFVSGGSGTILTSPDGSNWTARVSGSSAFLTSVASFPGGLISAGDNGAILTSSDRGQTWHPQTSGTTNWLSQARWLNDRLVAVGENGTLLTSGDGSKWVAHNTGTRAWLNAADYVDRTWLVVGNQGTVLASHDATNWYSVGSLTKQSLYGLVIHDAQLVAVGSEGVVLRSQLIPDPKPIAIAQFNRASGMNTFLFTGAPDQQFRLQSSTDLAAWTEGPLIEFLDSSGTVLYVEETGTNAPAVAYYRVRRVR